jgi:hypothetical protein
MAALRTAQLAGLSTGQLVSLSTTQVAALSTAAFAGGLSTAQVAALTTAQAASLSTSQVAALSTRNLVALSTEAIGALSTAEVAALSTAQIGVLTSAQGVGLTSAQVASLSTAQVAALSTSALAALDTADLVALSTNGIRALSTRQLRTLTTGEIASLTTTQVHALTTIQIHALTTDQRQALSGAQLAALISLTPIVLDLNGDGVQTTSLANGVQFDLAATGTKLNTGWTAGGDGLLALDRNGDGVINDGSELFGSGTTLANGHRAADGYAALAELDSNGDGSVDAKDGQFAQLKVWVDGNADGVSQADELKSLADLGITKLNLDVQQSLSGNNGNTIGATSTYETADGASHAAADVWFAVSATRQSLSGNVSGLSQALSSFGSSEASTTAKLEVPGQQSGGNAAQLAAAIQQFNADKPTLNAGQAATDDLKLKALHGAAAQGVLAVPGK